MTLVKSIQILTLISLLLTLGQDVSAQKIKASAKITVPPRDQTKYAQAVAAAKTPEQKRRYDTFMKVWQTIRDTYFDQTFGGLDWMAIWREFDPRVAKVKTDGDLHLLLEEMINRLNKSHFAIVPPEVYRAIENAKTAARLREKERRAAREKTPGGEEGDDGDDAEDDLPVDIYARYGIGIEMRLMGEQFVITQMIPGSAAEKAGLKTGYIIEKINDVSLREFVKDMENRYSRTKNIRKLLAGEIVTWMLNGAEGTDVAMTYLNERDEVKEIRIDREKLSGAGVSIGKNYPEQYLNFETRSIGEDVGYVKFNVFAMPIIEKFCAALTDFKNKKALIIDLRGNHGGLFGALMGISGMLSDRDVELGTQVYRSGSEKLSARSQAKNFKGKIVVLVDELSISSAEVLASAMQEGGRGLIVGDTTAGEALPAFSVELQTGAVLIYPIANLKTPKGKYLEGTGVTPDIAVSLDRKSLLQGRDLQLDTALKAIRENTPLPISLSPPIGLEGALNGPPSPPPPARPPPPPPASGQGSGRGTGPPPPSYRAPALTAPPDAAPPPPPARDEKSLEIIAEFVKKIGGEDAIRKIESYSVRGVGMMKTRGTEVDAEIEIYRQKPELYSELTKTNTIGEFREIYTKDAFVMQTDFGLTTELPLKMWAAKRDILAPILRLNDAKSFTLLSYAGIFDREDRKAHVINARSADGESIALAFDVETKLLVGYAGLFSTYSLGDYQKVQDLLLPFFIDRGNTVITIYDFKVNAPIDESNFKRKINCFDRPN